MEERNVQNIRRKNIMEDIIKKITPQDYGPLAEDANVEITGLKIVESLNSLYEIRNEELGTFNQIDSIDFLLRCVRYEEVRQFLYKYNFLALVRHLLLYNPTSLCKHKVVEILSILCQVKVDQTNPDYVVKMIEWIGKDRKLVMIIINYLWLGQTADESLIENTLQFLYSVALIVKMRPTSKWVVHLKKKNFKSVILYLTEYYHKVHSLTIVLATLVIFSEAILPETSNNSSVLNNIFIDDMGELIYTLCNMKYFCTINYLTYHSSVPYWEFYKTWLILVNNIKEKNLFVFNVTRLFYARNIYSHVQIILTFFEKALRKILKTHNKHKQISSFLRLFEHTIVVEKCMRLAAEFKKCKISLMTNLQVTCGIEQKLLTIRVLLDVLDDAFFCNLRLLNQNEGSSDTEVLSKTTYDRLINFKESLDQYLDSVLIEHSNDYYVLHNIVYQCMRQCEQNQTDTWDQTVRQEQVTEYLSYVKARILHMTRNIETHPLRQIFNTVKKKIEEFRFQRT